MKLKTLQTHFNETLSHLYPKSEIDNFFFWLIDAFLNMKRIDTVLHPNFTINDAKLELLQNALQRLKKEEPIQYIIGATEFYGLSFLIDKNTLIPRPETEELVDWILKDIQNNKTKSTAQILDIGTGSGCIAITLAKNLTQAKISALDVSKKALEVAEKNAKNNNVCIHFIESDILKTDRLPTSYDIIVSNPPYVRESEKSEIKNNVLQNEPNLALFVSDKKPLIFYEKIADLAKKQLKKNGVLYFEINQYLGEETTILLKNKGFQSIELRQDIFGNNRTIKASL